MILCAEIIHTVDFYVGSREERIYHRARCDAESIFIMNQAYERGELPYNIYKVMHEKIMNDTSHFFKEKTKIFLPQEVVEQIEGLDPKRRYSARVVSEGHSSTDACFYVIDDSAAPSREYLLMEEKLPIDIQMKAEKSRVVYDIGDENGVVTLDLADALRFPGEKNEEEVARHLMETIEA